MKPFLALVAVLVCALGAFAQDGRGRADDWFVTKTRPKQQVPPKQISSSELIPLPNAPAVPESATERKRPPSPEYLMGKVIWGQSASIGNATIHDWNLAGNDLDYLMQRARQRGFTYFASTTKLTEFDYDPKRLPALMISGVRPLKFTEAQTKKLREYVLGGGTIVADSVYGSPHFYESALQVFNAMFPESRFRVLPPDHPLYHMLVPIEKVRYAFGPAHEDKPFLEGIYIGSRVGVLLSKNGLGCGWEGKMDVFPLLEERGLKPRAYSVESARAIAENLSAYIIGYAQVGEIEGQPELFGLPDQKTPTAEFVFAQVKHDGAWNAHPGAARSLLLKLKQHSAIPVNLKRVAVDPAVDDLSAYPFLYFTGLDEFTLSPKAAIKLKHFVEDGGTLVINNSLGLASFHQAVPRELQRLFPDKALKRLPLDHPIYTSLFKITTVEYSPVLRKTKGLELQDRPALYGVSIGDEDNIRIIYSPYDLEAGWNEIYYPLMRGYMPESAQRLGMNIIVYAMTH